MGGKSNVPLLKAQTIFSEVVKATGLTPVSYTHLDVYKRQLQNCWEYYDFTRNADYLKEKIYPMMKEEATLYDQILIKDADGKLVSSPSYSPEHGPKTSGNTYEQTLAVSYTHLV